MSYLCVHISNLSQTFRVSWWTWTEHAIALWSNSIKRILLSWVSSSWPPFSHPCCFFETGYFLFFYSDRNLGINRPNSLMLWLICRKFLWKCLIGLLVKAHSLLKEWFLALKLAFGHLKCSPNPAQQTFTLYYASLEQ